MHGQAERVAERGGGHQADPQAGVRAGADADRQVGELPLVHAGGAQHGVDGRQQQFAVSAGVDLVGLGEHALAVVDGGRDGGGGGVEGEEEHGFKVRGSGAGARTGREHAIGRGRSGAADLARWAFGRETRSVEEQTWRSWVLVRWSAG